MKHMALILVLLLLLAIPIYIPVSHGAEHNEFHKVLIELPDGYIVWGAGYGNVSTVTQQVCYEHELSYSASGLWINVNGYLLQGYSWHGSWKSGIYGEIIGWAQSVPVATPRFPYPRISGMPQISYYSAGNMEIWNFSVGSEAFGAVDSTVVGTGSRLFFNSWNGLYSLADNGTLIWKNTTVKGMSTPYIYSKYIYVGSSNGTLYSFTDNGTLQFKVKLEHSPGDTGISSSPIIANQTLYVGGFESDNSTSYLFAFTPNGTELWNVSLNSTVYYGSPVYNNGTVYVPLAGKYNSTTSTWYPDFGIAAIRNGKVVWKFLTPKPVKSTPLFYHGALYFTCTDGKLYKLSPRGNEIWELNIGYSTASPNAYDGVIYVGSGTFIHGGKVYAISTNSSILWSFDVKGGVQGSITIAPPYIFVPLNYPDGGIICLNLSGSEIWNYTTWNYVLGSPSIIDRSLYFGDDSGHVYKLSDTKPPKIIYEGRQIYRVGEYASVTVRAKDNIGVKNLTVEFENKMYHGKDMVNLHFLVNFTGSKLIFATAEDYNGNTASLAYEIISYNKSLRIIANIPQSFEANKSTAITIKVVDNTGMGVSGAVVNVYIDNNSQLTGTTTQGGTLTFQLYVPQGTHTLRIVAKKEGYANAIYEKKVVSTYSSWISGSSAFPLLLGVVAIVGAISVGFAYVLRKRGKKYTELMREKLKNEK